MILIIVSFFLTNFLFLLKWTRLAQDALYIFCRDILQGPTFRFWFQTLKQRTTRKVQFLFLRRFLPVMTGLVMNSNDLWWNENLLSKSLKILWTWLLQNILLILMFLWTALIAKNIHILAGNFFIFVKSCPRLNLKGFQYQIWASVKRSGR